MMITTTNSVDGKTIAQVLGYVDGSSTRARNIGSDIGAGLKSLIGGEVATYTKLLEDTRKQAIERMTEKAKEQGADAVIGVRITTSAIAQGISEILAYGTAVKLGEGGRKCANC